MEDVRFVPGQKEAHCFVFPTNRNISVSVGPSMALHYLSLVALYFPDAISSRGASVAAQVATCIRTFLSPGNEPGVIGYYGWVDPKAAATLALARHNSAVWDLLSRDDQERASWLMRVYAVVGNLTSNASHECYLGVSLDEGPGGFVPNQRGYASVMSYVHLYFGGASAVNRVLKAFSFDTYLAKFDAFGWNRLEEKWTTNRSTRGLMEGTLLEYRDPEDSSARCLVTERGVRAPFTFRGFEVTDRDTGSKRVASTTVPYDPMQIFLREEAGFMYGLNVRDVAHKTFRRCERVGRLEGRSQLRGRYGMAYEFNSSHGRSSLHYVWAGQHIALTHYSTLVALGQWDFDDPRYVAVQQQLWNANVHYFDEAARLGWRTSDSYGKGHNGCGKLIAAGPVGGRSGLSSGRTGFKEQLRIFDAMFRDREALVGRAPIPSSASGVGREFDLIPAGASWLYLDGGGDSGRHWKSVGFEADGWSLGDAELGFGDGDEATLIEGDEVTYYFRRSFKVSGASQVQVVTGYLKRDDGAIVYVNGTEVFRSNMPEGPVTATTTALSNTGADENVWFDFSVDADLLRDGVNTVAVEVHNQGRWHHDLTFDLALAGEAD